MITFSCDAYENIVYFSDIAQSLLSLMGHSGSVPGALKAEEVPDALSRLQRGLGQEANKKSPAFQVDEEDNEFQIGLAKRAIPLINMLQAAVKKNCALMWS